MQALRSRYDALTGLGDKPGADAVLTELAAKDRTPDVARLLYNAGALAGNAKEIEVARARFEEALAIDPTLHQAHSALAELAIKEKKYPEAIAEIDLAIAVAPRNFKAYERKIEVQKAMGDKAGAEATEKARRAQSRRLSGIGSPAEDRIVFPGAGVMPASLRAASPVQRTASPGKLK